MRSRDTIQSKAVKIASDLQSRRRDDVPGAKRRPDAQGTSPIHSQMQSNVWGWHNIPIATVLIKFIDGRFVKFLYRCYSAHRFDQIVSELYKRRIAFKPFHRAATLLVRNRIVNSARTRAITCCVGITLNVTIKLSC